MPLDACIAIAKRSLRIQSVQMRHHFQVSLNSLMVERRSAVREVLGSNPGFGNGTLSKKPNFPFLMRIHLQLLSLKQVKVQDDMHGVFPCS